jgi:outer membrane protein assembly factor BamA
MPNVSYNTDVGLNLGAYSDFFYYGDGSTYPNFLHHIGVTACFATKGSWYLHGLFESTSLIPNARIAASVTYRDAYTNNFYGFNGIKSPFFEELELNAETRTAWYTNRRRFIRGALAFQGKLSDHLSWMAGGVFRRVWISDFSLKNYDSGNSLYLTYLQSGLIEPEEAEGGISLEGKAGFVYDSRDVELFPGKGIYGELYLLANGDLRQWKYNYVQLVAHWRHYLSLWPGRIIFAYHLGLQHTLCGNLPFYNINELAAISYLYEECSGLGSRYSVRGYRFNRIAAAGYAWGNFEFRVIPFKFNLFRQHFDIVLNPFVDLASITKEYRVEEQRDRQFMDGTGTYQNLSRPLMVSAGCGAKLHMNTNFILSVDVAKAFDPQLSDLMIGMGTTYVF